jgi:hypothetical protein
VSGALPCWKGVHVAMNWKCTYTRTYNGHCEQARARNNDTYCHYHQKVVDGLIEVDEQAAIRDLPAISIQ